MAEILERIRARLRRQARNSPSTPGAGSPPAGAAPVDMAVLRQLVAEGQAAQRRVGVVNPRLPSLHNDLI